ENVGDAGLVVGVDLQEVRTSIAPNVRTIVGDVFEIDPAAVLPEDGRLFTVVLSDMAPKTTGHGDDLVSARLCDRVLELLPRLLAPGGNLAMKIFEGAEYPRVLKDAASLFAVAKGYKPKASRD